MSIKNLIQKHSTIAGAFAAAALFVGVMYSTNKHEAKGMQCRPFSDGPIVIGDDGRDYASMVNPTSINTSGIPTKGDLVYASPSSGKTVSGGFTIAGNNCYLNLGKEYNAPFSYVVPQYTIVPFEPHFAG